MAKVFEVWLEEIPVDTANDQKNMWRKNLPKCAADVPRLACGVSLAVATVVEVVGKVWAASNGSAVEATTP